MTQIEELTQRLAALERQVLSLSQRLGERERQKSWLELVDGSMEGSEEFDEALRLGREARQAMTYEKELERNRG